LQEQPSFKSPESEKIFKEEAINLMGFFELLIQIDRTQKLNQNSDESPNN
jgi:lipid A disaccharide synthetase